MEDFKNLKRVALSELRKLDSQYAGKDAFSDSDIKAYDCLMHGLKCQLTVEAMMEASENWSGDENSMGNSGMRGRNSINGRYMSRDNNPQSYSEGYSQGYMDGQHANMSGHYPESYYPPMRRW